MPGEDVTIDLFQGGVSAGFMEVGSWVEYDTSNLLSYSYNSYTFSPANYSGGWRVISSNGSTVDIFAVESVGGFRPSTGSVLVQQLPKINAAFVNTIYATLGRAPTYSDITNLSALNMTTPASWTSTAGPDDQYYTTNGSYLYCTNERPIRPIITLRSDLVIKSGDGSQGNPYILEVED